MAEKRREEKGKGEKETYPHLNAEFQRIEREIRKPPSVINAKKERKTTEWERRNLFNKLKRCQGNILCKDGHIKGQKWHGPNRSRRY